MSMSWISAALIVLLAGTVLGQAETHRYTPTGYHNTFSGAHAPVLRIKPGDRVITKTIDAWGFDAMKKKVGERPNPQTGPFYIEGAERGDTLVVRLERIEPDRQSAWSGSLLAPYAVDPAFLRAEGLKEQQDQTWILDRTHGIASIESSEIRPGRIEVPLRPMLGCIATAPDRKEAIA